MAHFALLWKARTIEKYRQNYENEKINSIIMSNAHIPDKTLFQRWRHYSHGMQKRLSRKFSKWYPEGTTVSNFFVSLRTDMKLPSILLRSLYGFIGGLLLTYLGFMFFVFQLSLSLMHATVLSSVMGVLLTLGLTFSNRMRCLIFLLIPQLFSRVGKYTLTCYALVLILTGPATNTMKNSEVLSESMACNQTGTPRIYGMKLDTTEVEVFSSILLIFSSIHFIMARFYFLCFFSKKDTVIGNTTMPLPEQIKLEVRHINNSIKKPFNSIKNSLKITISSMKLIVRNLKIALIRINRLAMSIASVIESGLSWLGSVVNTCNKALGTPLDKCLKTFKENCQHYNEHELHMDHKERTGKDNLRKHLKNINSKEYKESEDEDDGGENINQNKEKLNTNRYFENKQNNAWFCHKAHVTQTTCASLKSYEKFCVAADFTEKTIFATIKKKLKTFTCRISNLLRMKLNIHHTYTFIGNSSSNNQIAAGIVTEIRNRADPILTWLSWSSCVTSLFLLLIIFRAKHYQHMFETRSPFDNRFITKEFRELDLKRLREGRETVLPLNRRERAKYVTTTSFRLVASEKVHLNRSAVFMTVTTFKLMIHIVADYSLYWVLMTIRHHGKLQAPLKPGLPDTGAFISGSGFVSRLLQSFIDSLHLQLKIPTPDNSCLPNPFPPDFKRYCQIGFLIFLLWFFALLEPYGLRLRHHIMGHYRPKRAKTRAVWLYNHILRTRASFMKFARRRLHREYKYSLQSTMTFRQWLRIHIPYRWLRSLLGIKPEVPHCLLCNIADTSTDSELIKCDVHNCPGTYCSSCYSDIGQLCTICLSPADYGDLSDVSLEKGSSDENDTDDDGNDNNVSGTGSKSYSVDRTNKSYDKDEEASTPKSSKLGERQHKLIIQRNLNTESQTFPLMQHACMILSVNNQWSRINYGNKRLVGTKNTFIIIKQCESTETKENHDYMKTVAVFKDLNNNICRKIMPKIGLLQYTMYEIKINPFIITKIEDVTSIAKYLRKKKLLKRKHKNGKSLKYFMTCSNTNITSMNEEIKQVDGNKDKAKESENNNLDIINKGTQNTIPIKKVKDNKSVKKISNETTTVKKKGSKVHSGYFHIKFFDYWKNVKLKILPCTLTETKRDLPTDKEKKHKRKKKHKKANDSHDGKAPTKIKSKKKDRVTGNSRLFAYLDERDWIKTSFEKSKQVIEDKAKEKEMKNDMLVNNITIPRLNLDFSSESIVVPQNNDANNMSLCDLPTAAAIPSSTANIAEDFADGALDRYFKSIVRKSTETLERASAPNVNNERVDVEKIVSFHNSKYLAYPTSSNYQVAQDGNKSQEKVKQLKLKRIFSGTFSGYKLSRPMSLIRTVYSSLFVHGVQSDDDKEKQTQTKNEKQIKWKDTQTAKKKHEKLQTRKEKERRHRWRKESIDIDQKTYENKRVEQFEDEKTDKEIQTFLSLIETVDKGTEFHPFTNTCGTQKNVYKVETHDCALQIERNSARKKPISQGYDVETMAGIPTCTCAAQCERSNKNIGVITDTTDKGEDITCNKVKEEPIGHPSCKCGTVARNQRFCTRVTEKRNEGLHVGIRPHNNFDNKLPLYNKMNESRRDKTGNQLCNYSDVKYPTYNQMTQESDFSDISQEEVLCYSNYCSSSEPLSSKSDESKTDTTICSLVNINYHKTNRNNLQTKLGRLKVKVITKANQSTLTERNNCCDVSTETDDWWSPMVEKKDFPKGDYKVEKKKRENDKARGKNRKLFRNTGVNAGDKLVTFRSTAQLIPNRELDFLDILSPSRYLLESQKYYNELFYTNFKSPRVFSVTDIQQKHSNSDKERSQMCHHSRRVRKTKRLEESYSPRKQIPPRRRGIEFVRSPESSRRGKRNRRWN